MEDLSLHLLDIMENSVRAQAKRIEVRLDENLEGNLLKLEITDNGRGMDAETLRRAMDPFFTTRTTRRVGLGLSMLAEAARATGGDLAVESKPDKGTRLEVTFRTDHIDMKPLGNIAETLITLITGQPDIEFYYQHTRADRSFVFDSRELRERLGDLPISSPGVLQWIRDYLAQGLDDLR